MKDIDGRQLADGVRPGVGSEFLMVLELCAMLCEFEGGRDKDVR